jgi:predicted metal-binding protein
MKIARKVFEIEKTTPFKNGGGISEDLLKKLLQKGKEYGLTKVLSFKTDKIVVAEWVHLKCRYGCKQYSTNWCCPPATPSPEKVRSVLNEYSQALLLVGSKKSTDFYLNNRKKRTDQVHCWKGTISLERMLFLKGYYKAFSLVGECCALCKECAYPEVCRFPQEKRPSVESFSIDVIGTLNNLGTSANVATRTSDTFDYYAIILLE